MQDWFEHKPELQKRAAAYYARHAADPQARALAELYEKEAGLALARRAAGGLAGAAKSVARKVRRPPGTSPTPRPLQPAPASAPVRPAAPPGATTSSRSGAVNIGETSLPTTSGRSGAVNLGTTPAGAAPTPTAAAPKPGPFSAQAAKAPPPSSAGQAAAPAGAPASAPAGTSAGTVTKAPSNAPANLPAGAPSSEMAAATAPKHRWGDVALGGGVVGVPAAAYLMGGSGQPQPY
jgi:hypothetical protein